MATERSSVTTCLRDDARLDHPRKIQVLILVDAEKVSWRYSDVRGCPHSTVTKLPIGHRFNSN